MIDHPILCGFALVSLSRLWVCAETEGHLERLRHAASPLPVVPIRCGEDNQRMEHADVSELHPVL